MLAQLHYYRYVSIIARNLKCLAAPIPKIWLGPK